MRKIFVVGFHKCGMTSLHNFFELSGLKSILYDGGCLGMRMYRNIEDGLPIISGYEDYDAFIDMNYRCDHYRIDMIHHFTTMLEQHPDARFILNMRDREKWIKSRAGWATYPAEMTYSEEHVRRLNAMRDCPEPNECGAIVDLVERDRRLLGLSGVDEVIESWRAEWDSHIERVLREIPSSQLLVFDIEKGDPANLCEFLSLPKSCAKHWGHHNRSSAWGPITGKIITRIPRRVRRMAPPKVRSAIRDSKFAHRW